MISVAVRQNDVQFLIYALLDTLVDELIPIIVAFQVTVTKMERHLHSLRRIEDFKLNKVQALQRQVLQAHRAVKPMREVVRNLIEDEVFNVSDSPCLLLSLSVALSLSLSLAPLSLFLSVCCSLSLCCSISLALSTTTLFLACLVACLLFRQSSF